MSVHTLEESWINMSEKVIQKLKSEPKNHGYIFLIVAIVLFMLIWSSSVINFESATDEGMSVAKNIIKGILNPNKEMLFSLTKKGVPYLLLETICIAFLGTLVGSIISIPLSFLASSNIVAAPIAYVVRLLIILIRTIPSIVYGLMFIRVTGPGPFAGLMTMSFTSIGMLTKLFSDNIMNLNKSILESFSSIGATTFQKIRFGIIPQLWANFASTTIYRFDINLRDAAVLGLVGAGGIGSPLMFAINSYKWREVGAILLGLIILVLFIEFFSTKIRAKLVGEKWK